MLDKARGDALESTVAKTLTDEELENGREELAKNIGYVAYSGEYPESHQLLKIPPGNRPFLSTAGADTASSAAAPRCVHKS